MTPAPTGDVTLVFTDIEGSSLLWEKLGGEFRGPLALHDGLLREAIAENHGYEVKTEGDAFMAAFSSASSALSFAVTAQRRLRAAPWPPELREALPRSGAPWLRVRVGMHSGAPICEENPLTHRMDYFGPVVNRAARIAAAAHGGQILLSETVRSATEVPEGVTIRHLGEHRLRGLARPETLHEAALDAQRFPPPRAVPLWRTNLKASADAFVGRQAELARLHGRLVEGGERLITLLGPGGVGKTRLAQRVGAETLPVWTGGVWFCDLNGVQTVEGVCDGVAQALGVPLLGSEQVDTVAAALSQRGPTLLILDTFEQAAAVAPATLNRWLHEVPELRLLVTSRQRLGVAGEQLFWLEPLQTEDAVALFAARARSANAAFSLDEETEALVRQIVEQLDGLALAVELAAARVRGMPLQSLLSRLKDRFQLLRSSRRDRPDRHATLRATLDGSWALLGEAEQVALARCCVFRSPFTLDAAAAVLAAEELDGAPWPEDLLVVLLDHSLLRLDVGSGRYRMLLTVREYAETRMKEEAPGRGAEAWEALQRRYAAHFAGWGEERRLERIRTWSAPKQRLALFAELEDVVAAGRWALGEGEASLARDAAVAAAAVLTVRGPVALAVELLSAAVELGPPQPGQALLRLVVALRICGRSEDIRPLVERLLQISRAEADARLEVSVLVQVAMDIVLYSGDRHRALATAQRALGLAEGTGDLGVQAFAHRHVGWCLDGVGRHGDALAHFEEARALCREVGNVSGEMETSRHLGWTLLHLGRFEQARRLFEHVLAHANTSQDLKLRTDAMNSLGAHATHVDDLKAAADWFELTLATAERVGSRASQCTAMMNLGVVLLDLDNIADAARLLRESAALAEALGRDSHGAYSRAALGLALARQGSVQEGRALTREGQARLPKVIPVDVLVDVHLYRAWTEQLAGELPQARSELAAAQALTAELPLGAGPRARRRLAELAAVLGETES